MNKRFGWWGQPKSDKIKITKVTVYDHTGDELVTHSFPPKILAPGDSVRFVHEYLYDKQTGQLVPKANIVP